MVFVALLTGNKLQKPDQVSSTISNRPSSNNFFLAKSPWAAAADVAVKKGKTPFSPATTDLHLCYCSELN
jgi:hypothetical protein